MLDLSLFNSNQDKCVKDQLQQSGKEGEEEDGDGGIGKVIPVV